MLYTFCLEVFEVSLCYVFGQPLAMFMFSKVMVISHLRDYSIVQHSTVQHSKVQYNTGFMCVCTVQAAVDQIIGETFMCIQLIITKFDIIFGL